MLKSCLTQLLLLNFLCEKVAEAGKILIYSPSISRSHLISNGRIADTLVDAGHDVVVFIPEYETLTDFYGTKKAKVITLKGFANGNGYMEDMEGTNEYVLESDRLGILERLYFERIITRTCDDLMKRQNELNALKEYRFDVAFSEQIDFCGVGVIRYLGIKNHLWISTTSIMESVSYNLGIPQPTSYVPTIEENDNGDVMNIWQRAFNLYMYICAIFIHRYGTDSTTNVFRKYIPDFPNVRDIAANSSLCFVNSDEILDLPRPTIAKNIFIGGLGVDEHVQPLNEHVESIMRKGKKGVVVVSLGSIVPFGALSLSKKTGVLAAIQQMPDYHFLIKISKDDNTTSELVSSIPNIDILTWLPQVDLLGHPRLKLFVMHGGINGLLEASLRGVPTVVVPLFADQFRNGRMVEKRGIGKVLLKRQIGRDKFLEVVSEVLNNSKYKTNVQRLSKMMRNKPFSAETRLVKWTEFAMNNGVLEELHIEGSRLNTILYFNLDVLFVFFVLSFLIFVTFIKLLRVPSIIFSIFSKKSSASISKKNQ